MRFLKILCYTVLGFISFGLGTWGGAMTVGLIFSYALPAIGFPTSSQRGSYISEFDFMKDGEKYVRAGSKYRVSYQTMRSQITACGLDVDRFIKNVNAGSGDQDIGTDSVHQSWTYGGDGQFHNSSYEVVVKTNIFNGTYRAFSRVTYDCNAADKSFRRINEMDLGSNAIIHIVCDVSNDSVPGRQHQPEDDYTDCGTKP